MTTIEMPAANGATPSISAGELAAAAKGLAEQGFQVMRCLPGQKFPKSFDSWKLMLTSDPVKVAQQWQELPGGWNIAIGCMESGVFVLDVDGPVAEEKLARLEEANSRLPRTLEARTPGRIGGGRHLYFRAPEGTQFLARIGPAEDHLDIKHNGYVMAPPSIHPGNPDFDIAPGGVYRWTHWTKPVDAPPWLRKLIERQVYDDLPETATPPSRTGGRWDNVESWFDATFNCQEVMVESVRLMKEWQYGQVQGGNHCWTRPGKSVRGGTSLAIYRWSKRPVRPCPGHNPRGKCERCAYTRAQMFSTADPDTPAGSYGPWRLYVHVCHDDDWPAAITELETNGFKGQVWERPLPGAEPEKMLPGQPDALKADFIWADQIILTEKEWVFPKLVPRAELTLVTGQPSDGKSSMVIDLIARLTRGEPHAGGPGCFTEPQKVLLLAGEDDWESVVGPRLVAAGADMSKVACKMRVADTTTGEIRGWNLRYMAVLEAFIAEHEIKVVVMDVLKQYMAHRDDNSELEVRRELQPIIDLCHRTQVTAIGVRHTVKKPTSASSSGSGSQAYFALCRSELLVTSEKDGDGSVVNVCTVNKSSYGVKGVKFEFRIADHQPGVTVRRPDGTDKLITTIGAVKWMAGWETAVDPDEMLAPAPEKLKIRVFKGTCVDVLRGCEALGFSTDIHNFRRMMWEKLPQRGWDGIEPTGPQYGELERKMVNAGIISKEQKHHGYPKGNESFVTLNEHHRVGGM